MIHFKKVIQTSQKFKEIIEKIEYLDLYIDSLCDLKVLNNENQVKVVEGILQSYCDVKLENIFVDTDFLPMIESTNNLNHIPQFKLETALKLIDTKAF